MPLIRLAVALFPLFVAPSCSPNELVVPTATTTVSADSTFLSCNVRLRYTIDWPSGKGPFPAVVLVHGSGRVPRDELVFLSHQFTSHGFAVLRYDKRGVGESEGVYSGVGVRNSAEMIPQLAADAAAALALLSTSPKVNRALLGYAGGSQAGWIIPVALRTTPRGAFGVILSGPTVSVGAGIAYSNLVEGTTLFHCLPCARTRRSSTR